MSTPRQVIAPNHPSCRGDERMSYLHFLLHTASSPGGSELLLAPYLLAVTAFVFLIAFLSSHPTITVVILTLLVFVLANSWRPSRHGA